VPHGLLLDNKQDVETVFVSICTQKWPNGCFVKWNGSEKSTVWKLLFCSNLEQGPAWSPCDLTLCWSILWLKWKNLSPDSYLFSSPIRSNGLIPFLPRTPTPKSHKIVKWTSDSED
jgi:hypothetical protein